MRIPDFDERAARYEAVGWDRLEAAVLVFAEWVDDVAVDNEGGRS